jgi:hypothetical protein
MKTTLENAPIWLIASLLVVIIALPHVADSQTAIRSDFDHDSTSFPLDGAHAIASCGDCHRNGVFKGTGRECEDCHADGGLVAATAKPARHILASERCVSCHATRSFIPPNRMDHNEVLGECISCHNNQTALGKPINHIPAGDQCDTCHLTVVFSPAFP